MVGVILVTTYARLTAGDAIRSNARLGRSAHRQACPIELGWRDRGVRSSIVQNLALPFEHFHNGRDLPHVGTVASSMDMLSPFGVGRSFVFRHLLPRPLLRLEDLGRSHLLGERITMLGP